MAVSPEPAGVYISSAQIYQELRSLGDAVTRVDAKVDLLSHSTASAEQQRSEHATRIRSLEQTVWRAAGGAAVLGAGVGVLVQFLPH